MVLISNVKWYINNEYWWTFEKLLPISNLSATAWQEQITLTWTDPSDDWSITWASTKLVRKTGSAPTTSSDGTLVLTETTRNQYSSTWYVDSWLTAWTTYYYKAFSVDNNWNEIASNSVNAIPEAAPSLRTYAQLTASTVSIQDALTELNSKPSEYYDMLTEHTPVEWWWGAEEWHLFAIEPNKSGVAHTVVWLTAENMIPYPWSPYSYNTHRQHNRWYLARGWNNILSVIKYTWTWFTSIDLYATDYNLEVY